MYTIWIWDYDRVNEKKIKIKMLISVKQSYNINTRIVLDSNNGKEIIFEYFWKLSTYIEFQAL